MRSAQPPLSRTVSPGCVGLAGAKTDDRQGMRTAAAAAAAAGGNASTLRSLNSPTIDTAIPGRRQHNYIPYPISSCARHADGVKARLNALIGQYF